MDNSEKLTALGTQDTGRRQTNHEKTQDRKLKRWATRTPQKTGDEASCPQRARSSSLL